MNIWKRYVARRHRKARERFEAERAHENPEQEFAEDDELRLNLDQASARSGPNPLPRSPNPLPRGEGLDDE